MSVADVAFLTVSNGGDVRYFIIPNDSYGDIDIEEIRTGGINGAAGSDAAVISTAITSACHVLCHCRRSCWQYRPR